MCRASCHLSSDWKKQTQTDTIHQSVLVCAKIWLIFYWHMYMSSSTRTSVKLVAAVSCRVVWLTNWQGIQWVSSSEGDGLLTPCQSQCPDDITLTVMITELSAGVRDGVQLLCDNLDTDSGEPGECEWVLVTKYRAQYYKVLIVNSVQSIHFRAQWKNWQFLPLKGSVSREI